MMQFRDDEHKAVYNDLMQRMAAEDWDTNQTLVRYDAVVHDVRPVGVGYLYDFEDGCIHSDALAAAWQTGTSMKTTRLAFNLFTDNTAWTDDPEWLAPVELFSCEYAPYYWQALKIRFPQYT